MSEQPFIRKNADLDPSLKARIADLEEELEKANKMSVEKDDRIAELEKQANSDPLTGAWNRNGWSKHLDLMFDIQHEQGLLEQVYAVMVDIDNFKAFNDTFGHDIGDEVLIKAADTIRGNVREYDVVGRFGGEEFVVALFGADDVDAFDKAEIIRRAIECIVYVYEGKALKITASIGVGTTIERHAPNQAVTIADHAMLAAKSAGRNQVKKHESLDE